MRLSVVFLSYNTRDLTEQALRTVLDAAEGMAVEVFVADNASVDGSAEMVAEKFPQVKLIRNESNVGFAAGNNVPLRRVVGEYVLIINTDTIVRRNTLSAMVDFLDAHPEAGACGCKILDPDGTLQLDSRRGFPTPVAAFCKMSGLSRLFPDHPVISHYHMTYLDPERTEEVEVISGSCMMVRKTAMDQVGLLDEDYFMYGEDIDWCYRIHQAGWKIYYVPTTEIIHFRGESGRGVPLRILYRKSQAMSIFVNKHMAQRFRFFPLWLLQVGIGLHGFFRFLLKTARALALPIVDVGLVLCGLKLGLAVRYHEDLVPFIYRIENAVNLFGLDAEPTRWLTPPPYSDWQWLAVYGVSTLVWLLAFYVTGLYDRRRYSALWSTVGVALGFAFIVTLVFFFKAYNFSRLAAGAAFFCNTVLIAGWRFAARWVLHQRGRSGRLRTLLVGTDQTAADFVDYLGQKAGAARYDLIGLVGQDPEKRGRPVAGRPVLGMLGELEELVRDYEIEQLVFTHSTMSLSLEQMGRDWGAKSLRISMVPVSFAEMVAERGANDTSPLLLIEIGSNK